MFYIFLLRSSFKLRQAFLIEPPKISPLSLPAVGLFYLGDYLHEKSLTVKTKYKLLNKLASSTFNKAR